MKRVVVLVAILATALGGVWLFSRFGQLDGGDSLNPVRIASLFVRESIKAPLLAFRKDVGRYPTTDEGLAALIAAPAGTEEKWKGPYIPPATPLDPWRREYRYQFPGLKNPNGFDLWSLGRDGIKSDDDIGNWKE